MPSKQEMGRHQQKHFAGVLLLQFRHLRRPRQVAIPRLNQGAKVSEGFKQQGSYRVNGTGTDSYHATHCDRGQKRPTPAFLNFNWSPRIMLSMTRNPAFPEQQLGALLQATCEIQYMNNVPMVAKSTVSDAT